MMGRRIATESENASAYPDFASRNLVNPACPACDPNLIQ